MAPAEQQYEVSIRSIGSGGAGVGELPDGRVVFVPGSAPGDRVRVILTQEKERWARGILVEILLEGPGRVPAPCPHYGTCDGCSLQHLEYQEQLVAKSAMVGEALRRIGGLEVEDPEVVPSPRTIRYRNKLSILFRRLKGGRVIAGFHESAKRSRILDVGPECLLPEEGLAELWRRLRAGWGPGARYLPAGGELRLDLRGEGDVGSLLIQGGKGDGDPQALLKGVPGLVSLWRREPGGQTRYLAGVPSLEVSWMEEKTRVRGGAFLQVNRGAGEILHNHVLLEAGDVQGLKVVEGYAGAGLLGKRLASRGASVVAIEWDPEAVKEARDEAPEGFTAVQARVEEELEDHLPVDLLILNPPRGGLDPLIPDLIREWKPPRVIYVSCDPATLARDLKRMGDGYEVLALKSFDLFPQTPHVETVASMGLRAHQEADQEMGS